jgi:hypothetical protein
MKSLLASVFGLAWDVGPMSRAHPRCVSFGYGAHLTHRDNGNMMRLVPSQRYRDLRGETGSECSRSVNSAAHLSRGRRLATM